MANNQPAAEPRVFEGGLSVDDRGAVGFVNDFAFEGVRRFYTVSNHAAGFVRAWHAHRREAKYVTVLRGAAVVGGREDRRLGKPLAGGAGPSLRAVRAEALRPLRPGGLRQRVHVAHRRRPPRLLLDRDGRGEPPGRRPLRRPALGHLEGRGAMSATRVLVLGASGMLGSMVVDTLSRDAGLEITATVRSPEYLERGRRLLPDVRWMDFDAADPDAPGLPVLFDGQAWVINAIGVIKPLIRDDDPVEVERAIRVNSLWPHEMARIAACSGARVIQIATDCVYSGVRGQLRREGRSRPHGCLRQDEEPGRGPGAGIPSSPLFDHRPGAEGAPVAPRLVPEPEARRHGPRLRQPPLERPDHAPFRQALRRHHQGGSLPRRAPPRHPGRRCHQTRSPRIVRRPFPAAGHRHRPAGGGRDRRPDAGHGGRRGERGAVAGGRLRLAADRRRHGRRARRLTTIAWGTSLRRSRGNR